MLNNQSSVNKSTDVIETITIDDSSNDTPPPSVENDATTNELKRKRSKSPSSSVSSLSFCSVAEQVLEEETYKATEQTVPTNTSQASTSTLEDAEFAFGPYVPIFRKQNDIFIDPKGILESYYAKNPNPISKRLACEVLPDDTIADAPSFVVPLLLKKKNTLPFEQASSSSSSKQLLPDTSQNSQNGDNSDQILDSSVENQSHDVSKQSFFSDTSSNANRKPVADYIKAACVASLTSSDKRNTQHSVSTLQDYYKSSAGELLLGIGLSRVMESQLQHSAKKLAYKLSRRGDNCETSDFVRLDSIREQLKQTEASNKVFKSSNILKCPRCPFKTEFAIVMNGHLETPHIHKKNYLCNWCDFKTSESANVLFHCLVKHKQRCRIEKPPPLHLCPYCTFEHREKRRMKNHLIICERQFMNNTSFLGPQSYGENEFPAVTSKLITREDVKAFDTTLKTLRLAAYNPHQIKVMNQPIIVVARQNIQNLSRSVGGNQIVNATLANSSPQSMINKDQIHANSIASQNNHSAQLLQILSGQNPNLTRGGILQYPRTQTSFMNGNSALRTASDFVMAPQNIPHPDNVAPQAMHTNDDLMTVEESQALEQPAVQTKNSLPNPKGSTFVICEICDCYIKDLGQLKSHMQWIHKVKIHQKMLISRPPLNCQKCQWRFFTDQGLERHLLGAHGLVTSNMQELVDTNCDSGRCSICGRAHASKLVAHMKEVHKLTLKPAHLTYKCTVCSATFNLYRLFENHVYSVHSDSVRRSIPSN